MNYHYSMVIQWSEEDQLFLVHLPEFPWQQFHTHGRTYEEAAKNGQEVIEAFVEMLTEEDKPLPEPRILPTKPLQVAIIGISWVLCFNPTNQVLYLPIASSFSYSPLTKGGWGVNLGKHLSGLTFHKTRMQQ
jgi:predicted RNase H-like HicB family nuclease